MKLIIFLSTLALTITLAVAAPELRSAKALKTELKDNTFSAKLSEGYHFNDKAPNGIQAKDKFIQPTAFLARELKIEKLPVEAQTGTAHLYVCDDKVTFCEMHSIPLGKTSVAEKKSAENAPTGKIDSHGFIVNDFDSALKKAQKEKKMLMVDFGARWCPACLRIESEIFSNKVFKQKTKNFVKAKIDIDMFASNVLEEKYNVKGVPTLIFLTTDGREIARFYDYQPMSFVNDVLAEVKAHPQAIEDLEKQKLSPELKQSLVRRYFFAAQNTKALNLMKDMNPKPIEYWFAKVGEAEDLAKKDPTQKKNYVSTLKEAIAADPESSRSIVWRSYLVDAISEEKEAKTEILKVAQESNTLTDKLLANDELLMKSVATDFVGEYTGLEGFYIAMINAETSDSAGFEAKKAWEKVITQGEKYKVTAKQPGASLRLLTAMMKAEDYDKALSLVNSMLEVKPQDGDLERRKMRTLIELKKYDEAVQIGEKALKNSYGVNEFFVVEPLAKAYLSLNKKDEAKKLISRYLSRNEINFSELQGIKGKLEKLSKEL